MTSPTSTPPAADDSTAMRTELKVLGVLGLLLLAVEGGLTLIEDQLSVDVQHLRSIPVLTARIRQRDESRAVAEQRQSEQSAARWNNTAAQVLFLGSSRSRDGLDLDAFEQQATRSSSRPVELVAIHPEGARISEWTHLYRNFIAEQERAPDLLVIGFRENDLVDAPSQSPTELARYYDCRLEDLARLSKDDVHGVDDWCHFMLSNASAIYAHRRRVEQQLLTTIIPGFTLASHEIQSATQPPSPPGPVPAAYNRLEELVAMAQRDHVEVVLVALPSHESQPLDLQLINVAQQSQLTLMDCRHPAGLASVAGPTHFSQYLATWLPLQTLLQHRDQQLVPTPATETTRWASGDQPARY